MTNENTWILFEKVQIYYFYCNSALFTCVRCIGKRVIRNFLYVEANKTIRVYIVTPLCNTKRHSCSTIKTLSIHLSNWFNSKYHYHHGVDSNWL